MKFTIQGELTDLNAYIGALNSSRWGGNAIKQSETNRVMYEALQAKLGAITAYPVKLEFRWYAKDKRKDIDNTAFAKKFVLDGLVEAGVLADDSRKYVSGFSDEFFVDKENPRVEVEIYPHLY